MKNKTVCMFGAFSGNNRGDVAILETILDNISPLANKIYIGSKSPKKILESIHHKNIHFFHSYTNYIGFKSIKYIWKSDVVTIGGGGLIFERNFYNIFFNHLLNIAFITFFAKLFGKKIYIFGVGAEKVYKTIPRFICRYILKNASEVSVRDSSSRKIIEEIFYRKDYNTFPDVVLSRPFNNEYKEKNGILIIPNSSVNIDEIDTLIKKCGETNITIYENEYHQNLAHLIGGKNNNVSTISKNNFPTDKTISYFSEFELIISAPMHGCIFSYISQTPFIAIDWNEKIQSFVNITKENYLIRNRFKEISVEDISNSIVKRINQETYKSVTSLSQKGISHFITNFL